MDDGDLVRRLIREVLAEELAALGKGGVAPQVEAVRIGDDRDLVDFARRVLALAEDADTRAAIEAGRYPFRLANGTADRVSPPAAPAPAGSDARIDQGVLTESRLARLPGGITRLLLGPGVNITPLARDKARKLGITIERIRPC